MWGNSLGWILSVIWTALVIGGLALFGRSLKATSDTTAFVQTSGVADPLKLPVDLATVLPADAGPADPVSLYRQAIELYKANPELFDTFAANAMKAKPEEIEPAVALLRQASGNTLMPIFADTPEQVVQFGTDKPDLTALNTLGNCALNLGLRTKATDKDLARKDYEAAMSLGARLTNERLCYTELSNGMGLLTGGATVLASLVHEQDGAKADSLMQFCKTLQDYSTQKIVPIQSVLSSIDQRTIDAHAGDVFFTAQKSKERMWRVEAALALGRYKYNAPTKGDNLGALRIATELAGTEHDPAVKHAAELSRDLTLEQMNMIH